MDKLLDKIGLYDFFVRLITGLTIFICADFFEILDFLDLSFIDSSFSIPSVLLGGYFVGIVMEEIVYLIKRISESIESKKSILEHEKKPSNYQQMKKDLIREGYEGLIENPLMNKVMAGSYAIAFCVFSVICICKLFLCNEYTFESIMRIITLIFLVIIFGFRYLHYYNRRIELIKRYHEAYIDNNHSQNTDNTSI